MLTKGTVAGSVGGLGIIAAGIAAIGATGAVAWPYLNGIAPGLTMGGAALLGSAIAFGVARWQTGRPDETDAAPEVEQAVVSERPARRQAFYDPLTGLPNRALFDESIQRLNKKPPANAMGALVLNVDKFKSLNDSLGPDVADEILCAVGQRIRAALGKKDKLFRIGGDEFVAIMQGIDDAKVQILANRVLSKVKRNLQIEDIQISLTASVGIAIWPTDHANITKIVDCADMAARCAKRDGGDQSARYQSTMRTEKNSQRSLLSELPDAIKQKEFELFYQPRLNVSSGRVESFEALLRWRHPVKGLLTPDKFIDVLENSPLIIEAGTWALESACRQVMQWHSQGHNLRVSVNVAARQFRHHNFVQSVRNVLDRTMTNPALLELEITESQLLGDLDTAAATIEELKLIGVTVSIDDFGTGYSSLAYLHKLPIDSLKIDRSFVQGIVKSPMEGRVASAIISLGHTLGLQVVAEGVETEEQAEQLRRWGCDELQGYRFGKPQPVEEVSEMLAAAPTRDHPELVADEVIEIQEPELV